MGNAAPTDPVEVSNLTYSPLVMIWHKELTWSASGWSRKTIYTVPSGKRLVAAQIWFHVIDTGNLDYIHFESSAGADISSDPGGVTPSWSITSGGDEHEAMMDNGKAYNLVGLALAPSASLGINASALASGARNIILSARLFVIDA